MLNYFQSDFGIVVISPWLATKSDELKVRKNGMVDMRFRSARRFFSRLNRLAEARYLAGVDG